MRTLQTLARTAAVIALCTAWACAAAAPLPTQAKPATPAAKPAAPAAKPATPPAKPATPAPKPPTPAPKPPAPKPPAAQPNLLDPALAGPMAGVQEIIYAARRTGADPHWYANFSYYAEDSNRKAYTEGAKLCRRNLRTGETKVLLDDPKGGVRDPVVHYDGKKILFAYRKGGTDPYHLYEIGIDGAGLKQLTDGEFDDIEPAYLPDGDIVFGSARCRRWVNCWLTQVAVLYRCGPNGENVRPLSSNNDHDNTPWVLPDGRILYMRWEYVDRSQVHYHHLWTMNPDGTGQAIYYGNFYPGIVMLDSKPIPGTDKVVSIFSPGHGIKEHRGPVTIVDPNGGPDALPMTRNVNAKNSWRDPWAFSEDCFMVAGDQGILLMDGQGAVQTIVPKEGDLDLHEPRPLITRPRERIIPPRSDPGQPTGRLLLADILAGRKMDGVKPGEIKKLLILEILPQPIHFYGGMEPISIGGTFMLERVLGTVPVEPDGSAYFEVPALRSLFFVALDSNDNSVKRMQSFYTIMPGETTGCTGCHEKREQSLVPAAPLAALKREPSRIAKIPGIPEVFDFPRDIQPILDKHCLKCHNVEKREAGVLLSGDRGPTYSQAYATITFRGLVADGRNKPESNYPPRTLGAGASRLMKKIDGSHHDVKVTDHERAMIRYWIESGAVYPGTYAAPNSGSMNYVIHEQGFRVDAQWPSVAAAREAIGRRCRSCHQGDDPVPWSPTIDVGPSVVVGKKTKVKAWLSRHFAFNLTHAEKSLILLGPLAKAAGGLGICQARSQADSGGEKVPEIFADSSDPDYKKLLTLCQESKRWLDENKRFDMPGFRPNDAYVREMKRYGVLPATLGPKDPVDPYAADRKYWESFWHAPAKR